MFANFTYPSIFSQPIGLFQNLKELKINFTQSMILTMLQLNIFFTKYFGFFSMGIAPTIICLLYLPEMSLKKLGFSFISDTFSFH